MSPAPSRPSTQLIPAPAVPLTGDLHETSATVQALVGAALGQTLCNLNSVAGEESLLGQMSLWGLYTMPELGI